jgi:hypothetical protein
MDGGCFEAQLTHDCQKVVLVQRFGKRSSKKAGGIRVEPAVGADRDDRRIGVFAIGALNVPRCALTINCTGQSETCELRLHRRAHSLTGMCRSIRMQSNSEEARYQRLPRYGETANAY